MHRGEDADTAAVPSAAMARSDLHSFRLAHPVVHRSNRLEVGAFAVLSIAALTIWLIVLPIELLLQLQMTF
jgi:hypothetical protein